jgi:hydrogenase nickel incorporation protein HypB
MGLFAFHREPSAIASRQQRFPDPDSFTKTSVSAVNTHLNVTSIDHVPTLNDEVAALNRRFLCSVGVTTINLMGGPGCGKTTLIEKTIQHLRGDVSVGVICGELTTDLDGMRLQHVCDDLVQVQTGRSGHLNANHIRHALRVLDLSKIDLLVIENLGNLICPAGVDLGQDHSIAMFSVTDGDQQAAKHHHLLCESSVLLLNKTDLCQHVLFDRSRFLHDVARGKTRLPVFEVSASQDDIEPWTDWLRDMVLRQRGPAAQLA